MFYAATPARRARQIASDLAVLGWVLFWFIAGRTVHDLVAALAAPAGRLQGVGAALTVRLQEAGVRMNDVPVVGEPLGDTFRQLSGLGDSVAQAGENLAGTVLRLALILGLVTAVGPMLTVLIPWARARLRFARTASATRKLLEDGSDLDLFALRALAHQPVTALAKIGPDPAGAWRSGDPITTNRLAALELRASGLRVPVSADAGGKAPPVEDGPPASVR